MLTYNYITVTVGVRSYRLAAWKRAKHLEADMLIHTRVGGVEAVTLKGDALKVKTLLEALQQLKDKKTPALIVLASKNIIGWLKLGWTCNDPAVAQNIEDIKKILDTLDHKIILKPAADIIAHIQNASYPE